MGIVRAWHAFMDRAGPALQAHNTITEFGLITPVAAAGFDAHPDIGT